MKSSKGQTPPAGRIRLIELLLGAMLGCSLLMGQAQEPFRFVAVGDTGSDTDKQRDVADRMWTWLDEHPFTDVLMLGDNIYCKGWLCNSGGDKKWFPYRFDAYYERFLNRRVRFRAVLGNHDAETRSGQDEIEDTRRFGITGPRGYYRFSSPTEFDVGDRSLVDFFALNSTLDEEDEGQIRWLEAELQQSDAVWKIAFLHHPLYTPRGKHKPHRKFRAILEPLFKRYGVQIVLAGHNHFYARMKPIKKIVHFTSGGGGRKLYTPKRKPDDCTAVEPRKQAHFVYLEVYEDRITFEAVPGVGDPFDSGAIDQNYLNGTYPCDPW